MAENKNSFILYTDLISTVSILSDTDAGKLFKTILQYVNDQNPEPTDMVTKIAFEPVKQQLKRDLRKWEDKQQKRSEAGKKGAAAKWHSKAEVETELQSMANDGKRINGIAKMAVNDNVTVNDSVNVSVIRENRRFTPPTREEVVNHMATKLDDFTAQGQADKFINFYESNGWKVGKNPMKKWKAAASNWVANMKNFERLDPKLQKEPSKHLDLDK
jgi:hypothetical protein